MKKKIISALSITTLTAMLLAGCKSSDSSADVYPQVDSETSTQVVSEATANTEAATLSTEENSTAATAAENKTTAKAESSAATTAANSNADYIGEDKAKETALEHAGLKESEVQALRVKLDRDDGIDEYEIEFYVDRLEYNYEINATNGEIISYETEYDD